MTKRRAFIGVSVLALIVATAAFAAWFTTSSGFARGKIGKLQPLVVTDVAFTGEGLMPGTTGPGEAQVTNPNSPAAAHHSSDADRDHSCRHSGCETPSIAELTASPLTGLSISVPSGESAVQFPGLFSLGANSPSECQDSQWRVAVQVTARKGG